MVLIRRYGESDPGIPDRQRVGEDLLARLDELTAQLGPDELDGWRPLLRAAGDELERLRATLKALEWRIERELGR